MSFASEASKHAHSGSASAFAVSCKKNLGENRDLN